MIIKKYIVKDMNEAMARIRYDLGKEAIIISQKKVKRPGIRGFFMKKVIEVVATADKANDSLKDDSANIKDGINTIKNIVKSAPSKNLKESENLAQEVHEMKDMLNKMAGDKKKKTPGIEEKIRIKLQDSDVNEECIKEIMKTLKENDDSINEFQKAKKVLESMASTSKGKMEGRIILVGPTGVGKTTTIAKLAGMLSLGEKKKVGLITIDTYRIGAIEQLKTYADIMNIPFKVVMTIKEMENAIKSMKDMDAILIDTTGRNSKNTMQISELRAYIEKAKTDNIHLVVSATTKNKDLKSIIEGYKILNYSNVIVTKLDETTTFGSILNAIYLAKKPLSYVTLGQNVPDDIDYITSSDISKLILGEDDLC